MFSTILNSLAIFLSISTATGILVHDTKIDKATVTALTSPLLTASFEASTKSTGVRAELHPHVERTSLAKALSNTREQNPRVKPRARDDKKHLLSKHVGRGHHAFDNYSLPIV